MEFAKELANKELVVVLYNELTPDAPIDDLDILTQVELVSNALTELGFEVVRMPFSTSNVLVIEQLVQTKPKFVFNLVEPLNHEAEQLSHLIVPSLLALSGLPYTGCSSPTSLALVNKLMMKSLLRSHQVLTPDWVSLTDSTAFQSGMKYILKPASESASVGLDENPVRAYALAAGLRADLEQMMAGTRRVYFAEQFIDGREFRASVFGGKETPEVLPLIELIFEDFKRENKLEIYGYQGKWAEDSFEFQHTKSKHHFDDSDFALIETIQSAALECWKIFDMRGYASLDFRVDAQGNPWIVDINSNPCLTYHPGGVIDALRVQNLGLTDAVKKIINGI